MSDKLTVQEAIKEGVRFISPVIAILGLMWLFAGPAIEGFIKDVNAADVKAIQQGQAKIKEDLAKTRTDVEVIKRDLSAGREAQGRMQRSQEETNRLLNQMLLQRRGQPPR